MLDKPGLAATRRPFQHDRHKARSRRFEEPDLAVDLGIERLIFETILLNALLLALYHRLNRNHVQLEISPIPIIESGEGANTRS